MSEPNNHTRRAGLRAWWTSPPRTGIRLVIAPWEYRHLHGFARVRIAAATILACLGLVTLSYGGNDAKTYAWALAFVAAGAAQLGVACWLLQIARSQAPAA